MKRLLLIFASLILTASPAFAERIICASTTSTQNSGLFDHLLPLFTNATGIEVHVIAAGTGAAIETAKRGDVDVVLVHARELEMKAVKEGWFVGRRDLMYNDFVIAGPPADPAGIRKAKSAADAFAMISKGSALFISRGDNSGTHTKELALWSKAGISPASSQWYLEAGQGMEKTLRIASEKQAYTLTDRGTWLAVRDKMDMALLFEGDPVLFNQYGVMAVNPAKHPHVKHREAMRFIEWLASSDGQRAIGAFKDKNGNPLFMPNAGPAADTTPPLNNNNTGMGFFADSFREAFGLIAGLDAELLRIISLSILVSGSALVLASILGLPAGALLALARFRGRGAVIAALNTLMGLPPVTVGLFVYLMLSRSGPFGVLGLLYTPSAMIIAQAVLAAPIIASLSLSAISAVDPVIRLSAETLGATRIQSALTVIREARFGILCALLAGFGRLMAEVGAVIIVGGNIAGYTRVMTTTIAIETDKGNFELAVALGVVLLLVSLVINMGAHFLNRAASRGAA